MHIGNSSKFEKDKLLFVLFFYQYNDIQASWFNALRMKTECGFNK